jgi:hypothetical protein
MTQAQNVAIESSQINSSGVLQPAGGGTGVTTSTGSGNNVLSTSPTLTSPTFVTPALGTPASGILTNCTFPTFNQNTTGSSGSCTGNAATATNVAGIIANATTTYGNINSTTAKNGYYGYLMGNANTNLQIMADSSGNGGFYKEAGTGAGWPFYFLAGNAGVGIMTSTTSASYAMYVNGALYATGNVVAYSDRRKKENIETVSGALDKVDGLRGVYYNKIDDEDKKRQIGVIAQEAELVLPEVVTYAADVDEYGVAYGNMAGLFIEAIKELRAEVKGLKAEIAELRSK